MEKGLRLAFPLVILFMAFSTLPAFPQEEPTAADSLAGLLPQKTHILITCPSLMQAWEGFTSLPLYEAYLDEEVQTFLQSLGKGMDEFMPGLRKDLLEELFKLPEVFDGEIGLAVVEVGDEPTWVFTLTATKDLERASVFVEKILVPFFQSLFPWGPNEKEIGDAKVYIFEGPSRNLYVADGGGRILITDQKACLEDLLERRKRPAGSLAGHETYRNARARTGTDTPSFLIYLAMEELCRELMKNESDQDREIFTLLGFEGLRSITACLTMAGGRAKDVIFLDIPGEKKGLLNLFSETPVDISLSRLAPENTLILAAGNFKLHDLYQTLMAIVKADPRGPLQEFNTGMNELMENLGIRSFSDLVVQLGTEVMVFAALPKGGGLFPSGALAVEVLEPDRLQTNLFALARTLSGIEPETVTFRNRQIHYLPLSEGRGPLDLSVCWCMTDGYLFCSHHPTVLKGVIRRLEQGRGTLMDDSEFETAWKGLPKGARAVAYANSRRVFNYLYGLILPFASMAGGELPFEAAMLPSSEAIEGYLSFGLSGITTGEQGIMVSTDSDGYGPTSLALYGLTTTMLWIPFGEWSKEVERYPSCGGNQKRLFDALETYRQQHERYPATLDDLISDREFGFWFTRCPKVQQDSGGDADQETVNFAYVVSFKGMDPPESFPEEWMVLWDDEPRHNEGRVVCLGNGEVTWMPEETFQKRLKEQK